MVKTGLCGNSNIYTHIYRIKLNEDYCRNVRNAWAIYNKNFQEHNVLLLKFILL